VKALDLVGTQRPAGMPRRTFLRNSLLAGVPLLAAGLGLPKAAFAASGYIPPTRVRGATVRSVKDYGAVGDGVHDDTSAFQAAVNALPADGGTVVVPAGNYLIDPVRRVTLRSKMHLKLDPAATLTAKSNSADRAYVLMVYRVSDVEISGGRIIGDRDRHLGTTGEWGHGIQVRGASRVTIRDIHVSRCWGDGICIGGAEIPNQPTIYSYDVAIANVVATGNRRQALTIGRSTVIRVYDSELSYAGGIAPGCGIDIEPDPDKSTTKLTADITINNCWIHHNQQNGVLIYKQVNRVTIKNCKIEYNGGYGVLAMTAKGGYLAGNNISHNYLEGVMIRLASDTYTFAGNTCRNNKTRLWGVVTTGTLAKLVGLVSGTGAHIQVTTDCTNVKVTTNYYAK
jgi:hypothetical protein